MASLCRLREAPGSSFISPQSRVPDQTETVRDAQFRQLNAHREDPAYPALDGYEDRVAFFATQVGRKWEIDAALYDEFLNLLPPRAYQGDSFVMREFLFDDITHRFSRADDRHFCGVVAWPPRPTPAVAAAPIRIQTPEPQGRGSGRASAAMPK